MSTLQAMWLGAACMDALAVSPSADDLTTQARAPVRPLGPVGVTNSSKMDELAEAPFPDAGGTART